MEQQNGRVVLNLSDIKTPQELALCLRAVGMTYTDIAKEVGCTRTYAQKIGQGEVSNIRYTWWLSLYQLSQSRTNAAA